MRLLTRGSALAMIQAEEMAALLRTAGLSVEVLPWSTRGDRDDSRPLSSFGGTGAFSSCLEEALLRGEGEGAVHSLKDLPSRCGEGLAIAAVLPAEASWDTLVSREGLPLSALPQGALVGTSSPRRKAQLLRARPDLTVRELRGNIPTRLKKLDDGLYDAIVLARAGLSRLGISPQRGEDLSFLPAPCQGIIALEAPVGSPLFVAARALSHRETYLRAVAERALLRTLGVGCHLPFAALAQVEGAALTLEGEILDPSGRKAVRLSCRGPVTDEEDALRAGETLGVRFQETPEAAELLALTSGTREERP